jgi:hypothetical protein
MLFDYFNRMEDEAEEAGDKSDENSDLAELYQSSNESEVICRCCRPHASAVGPSRVIG